MENKCPSCHSTNIRNDSVRNDNGIVGSGYKSWLVEEKYSCNDCGVYFKPIGGMPPTEAIPNDEDVKDILPGDLHLAVMGHGNPERAVTGPRWVKGEYERLYEQLKVKPDRKIICWVDYSWNFKNGNSVMFRDICTV